MKLWSKLIMMTLFPLLMIGLGWAYDLGVANGVQGIDAFLEKLFLLLKRDIEKEVVLPLE